MVIIVVTGNISAGKSTLVKKLEQYLPNFKRTGIDETRREVGDGTISGEYKAWAKLFEEIESREDLIVELTGAGVHTGNITDAISRRKDNALILYLNTPAKECWERTKRRRFTTPYPWGRPTMNLIIRLEQEISDNIKKLWSKFTVKKIENIADEELIKVVEHDR